MFGLRLSLFTVLSLSIFVESVSAQPRGGIGERDRGLLGRVGARRDERLNRNVPPPAGANPNAALNPALNPNLAPNGRAANPAAAAAAARTGIAPNLQALGYPNNSPLSNRNPSRSPTPAPEPQAGSQSTGPRSAYYPETAADVRPASASAPANRLPYSGPGVLIRMPRTIPGEVNYLIDDAEHLIVHSGEDQLLRLKGSYEVRFSRGVTEAGRSYGEARYTITEGVYRFDVSANGWELYREGEARDVALAIADAQERANVSRREEEMTTSGNPLDQSSASLPPLFAPREPSSSTRSSFEADKALEKHSTLPPPSPTPPEESLPAPKSILEPS